MKSRDLRQKFLDYFKEKDHTIIASSSLVPENDPTVLFTTAGMFPLIPYLLGEKHPHGSRLTDAQKCIRTDDIEEVGDKIHHTFFEMMGNWSFGDYFKSEAIEWSFEFLTSSKWLNIPLDKLAFTVFAGDDNASFDQESHDKWLSLGVKPERIAQLSDNWWKPGDMGPCGPDSEMFFWTGPDQAPLKFDPEDERWVEIWNDVFMQFNRNSAGNLELLKQQNVDTGMGAERTVGVLNGKSSVYEIEPMATLVCQVAALIDTTFDALSSEQNKAARIIADHLRTSTFILAEGMAPSNVDQGYILRRLLRRAIRYGKQLGITEEFCTKIADVVIAEMGGFYPELRKNRDFIMDELAKEEEKFAKTLDKGLKEFEKIKKGDQISGTEAFKLFSTYGFPLEMTRELALEKGISVDEESFDVEFKKHQEESRQGAEKKFKGGLADDSEVTARMHTATHLLLAALRIVLGDHVYQKGANITAERIRFDFSHSDKMTPEQIKQVEDLVNEQIAKALPVELVEMTLDEAKEAGAMGVFEHKYGEKVKVYTIGDFSKEICGGPHAKNLSELGHFKIAKEESSSSGVRRIKAILE